ncbi:MAG: tetratricopeptide repeat protein [bacterium]|nr:tetratricopeptide repeat protein [bacterium]
MKIQTTVLIGLVCVLTSCGGETTKSPAPEAVEAQATSFVGELLYAPEPATSALEKYEEAKLDWQEDSEDVERAIWYGRRTAYLGRYNEAIEIYTEAIQRWPDDARLFRHRGHRYISTRQLDLAVQDFEKAAELIEGTEDEIEPDGMPNALNIPVSSLHTNTWYHLGLAHYLKGQYEEAVNAYLQGLKASRSADNVVSTTHWLYMALRRLGRDEEAIAALELVNAEMEIIENMAYHQLCLFYKGEIGEAELTGADHSAIMNAATAYGLGTWNLANGDRERAGEIYTTMIEQGQWAAFGHIAAEADLARGLE